MRVAHWAAAFIAISIAGCRATNDIGGDLDAEFTTTGVPRDWGQLVSGTPSKTAEAVLANAVARRITTAAGLNTLLTGWPSGSKVDDAVVAVPLKLKSGDHSPFGDGQINRSIEWQGWPADAADVPLASYAAFVQGPGWSDVIVVVEVNFQLAKILFPASSGAPGIQLSTDTEVSGWQALKPDEATQSFRVIFAGPKVGAQLVSGSAYPATVVSAPAWLIDATGRFAWPRLKVQLSPKADGSNADARYWPLLFRFPTQLADDAEASMPANQRMFSSTGRGIAVPAIGALAGTQPVQALDSWFEHLNGNVFDRNAITENAKAIYVPDQKGGVHHHFPSPEAPNQHQTAVGKVITYVVKDRPGGTEVLYTCFDARSKSAEAIYGVPSGAGWHSIGAPTNAETIVNNYESTGILAGWAVETPNPFEGDAPFAAKDVATFRIVRQREAFTTVRGHLHWYAVDAANPVCVTIWKHGCEPKSDSDLSCK